MIEKGKKYRIKGNSLYFKNKYGTCNPTYALDGPFDKIFGYATPFYMGHMAPIGVIVFVSRAAVDGIPTSGRFYYGKVNDKDGFGIGEIVHESELEEIS